MSMHTPCECGFFDRDRRHSAVGGGSCKYARARRTHTQTYEQAYRAGWNDAVDELERIFKASAGEIRHK